MSDTGWMDIEQRSTNARGGVRLRLAPGTRGSLSALHLTVPPEVAGALGWDAATRIGLQLGQGRFAGWLRFAPHARGRRLRRLRGDVLVAALRAPDAWQGYTTPSTRCDETRTQGDALLVEIPWDMDELDAAPAEEEEAA